MEHSTRTSAPVRERRVVDIAEHGLPAPIHQHLHALAVATCVIASGSRAPQQLHASPHPLGARHSFAFTNMPMRMENWTRVNVSSRLTERHAVAECAFQSSACSVIAKRFKYRTLILPQLRSYSLVLYLDSTIEATHDVVLRLIRYAVREAPSGWSLIIRHHEWKQRCLFDELSDANKQSRYREQRPALDAFMAAFPNETRGGIIHNTGLLLWNQSSAHASAIQEAIFKATIQGSLALDQVVIYFFIRKWMHLVLTIPFYLPGTKWRGVLTEAWEARKGNRCEGDELAAWAHRHPGPMSDDVFAGHCGSSLACHEMRRYHEAVGTRLHPGNRRWADGSLRDYLGSSIPPSPFACYATCTSSCSWVSALRCDRTPPDTSDQLPCWRHCCSRLQHDRQLKETPELARRSDQNTSFPRIFVLTGSNDPASQLNYVYLPIVRTISLGFSRWFTVHVTHEAVTCNKRAPSACSAGKFHVVNGDIIVWVGTTRRLAVPWRELRKIGVYTVYYQTEPFGLLTPPSCVPLPDGVPGFVADEVWDYSLENVARSCKGSIYLPPGHTGDPRSASSAPLSLGSARFFLGDRRKRAKTCFAGAAATNLLGNVTFVTWATHDRHMSDVLSQFGTLINLHKSRAGQQNVSGCNDANAQFEAVRAAQVFSVGAVNFLSERSSPLDECMYEGIVTFIPFASFQTTKPEIVDATILRERRARFMKRFDPEALVLGAQPLQRWCNAHSYAQNGMRGYCYQISATESSPRLKRCAVRRYDLL